MLNESIRLHGYSYYPIPYINICEYELDKEVVDLVSEDLIQQYKIIPLDLITNNLTIGMVDPTQEKVDNLKKELKPYYLLFFIIEENHFHLKLKEYKNEHRTLNNV